MFSGWFWNKYLSVPLGQFVSVYIIAAGNKERMILKFLITSSLTSNLMVRTLTLEILHIFRLPSLHQSLLMTSILFMKRPFSFTLSLCHSTLKTLFFASWHILWEQLAGMYITNNITYLKGCWLLSLGGSSINKSSIVKFIWHENKPELFWQASNQMVGFVKRRNKAARQ